MLVYNPCGSVFLWLWVSKVSSLSLPPNATAPAYTLSRTGHHCHGPGDNRVSVTMEDCRPLFNWVRTLPNYALEQDFQEYRKPRLPNRNPPTPPYTWWDEVRHCALRIIVGSPFLVDNFSFKQARALATELIEECQDYGGFGGSAVIGKNRVGWTVVAIGIDLEPEPGGNDTTFIFGEKAEGNMTVVESLELDSDTDDAFNDS